MNQPTLPGIDLSVEALVGDAVRLLKQCLPDDGQPYYGCFSGGKDSVVIKELARLAEVAVEWHYNVTTIDPPELVHFIKREHPDVKWVRPKQAFFTLAVTKGFPTRRRRWCCAYFKEQATPQGSRMMLGVRAAESPRRAKMWQHVTYHTQTREYAICPILLWQDVHVWDFIRGRGLAYCRLYDEGFNRLGCIGCPMARKAGREREFARWPGFERKWKQLFQKIWKRRTGSNQRNGQQWFGDRHFSNWQEMWNWWISDEPLPKDEKCQGLLELFS